MKNLTEMNDRELLEAIFANHIALMQKVYRLEEYVRHVAREKGEHELFLKGTIHKDAVYSKSIKDIQDFKMQYSALMKKEQE